MKAAQPISDPQPSPVNGPAYYPAYNKVGGIFLLLTLASGMCGTGYEVLYNRALAGILGHTFSVNASILSSFLLGVAIGSLVAHRFRRYLWLVESGLGLYTIGFFWLISISESYGGAKFLYIFSSSHSWALAGACALTLIPATLAGMSVPMFSRYIQDHFSGQPFRVAYILYNLGALFGVLLTEFLLLRIMPVSRTAFIMGGLNLTVGCAIFFLGRGVSLTESAVGLRNVFRPSILFPLFILSVSSSVFQLFFLKTVYYTTGRFNANFALALAVVFFYIGAGTQLVRAWPVLSRWVFPAAVVSTALWVALQPVMLFMVAVFNSVGIKLSLPFQAGWIVSIFFLGFPLLFFGASVPACMRTREAVSRDSGFLLFVSGMGNVFGYLLFVLVLHPNLRIEWVITVGVVIGALSIVGWREISRRARLSLCAVSVLFLFAGAFTWSQTLYFLSLDGYKSVSIIKRHLRQTLNVEEFPSNEQTFALRHYVSEEDGKKRMKYFIDGYVSLDLPSEESIAGSVAAMYARQRDRVLVLGFGTGMSAGAASVFFKGVDLVELNPEVVRLQDRFSSINFNVHRWPKTRVVQDDGFQYLLRSGKKYDLIINSVTAPYYPASSKMYSDEFYGLAARRLNRGGVFSNWFDSRLHPDAISVFIKTLGRHFPYCAMNYIYDAYYVIACSDKPLKADLGIFDHGDVPPEKYEEVVGHDFKKRLKQRALVPNIFEPGILKFLGVGKKTPVNRLDWPILEYYHPEEARKIHFAFMRRILSRIDLGYSLVDARPMTKGEFADRCKSMEDWFEKGVGECERQFEERFGAKGHF